MIPNNCWECKNSIVIGDGAYVGWHKCTKIKNGNNVEHYANGIYPDCPCNYNLLEKTNNQESRLKMIPNVELRENKELVEVLQYDASIVETDEFAEYSEKIQNFVNGLDIGFDFSVKPPTLKIHAKDYTLTLNDGNYLVKPINSLCVTEKECVEKMESVSCVTVSNLVIPNKIS